jgi:hypothetical protein
MRYLLAVVILLVAASAFAQPPCPDIEGCYPVGVWKWVDGTSGQWVPQSGECALARLFACGGFTGECNKRCWEVPVTIHASVAQWLWFNVSGTGWKWFVMKPGTYCGDCIGFDLKSNGSVAIDYQGFENLYSATACDQYIETWYAYGSEDAGPPADWVPATALNDDDDVITEEMLCRNAHRFFTKLWVKIQVDSCNTACEYHDEALITLCLENQKCWVDADGSWWDRDVCD